MTTCSGCGAPTASARCDYCGHVNGLQSASPAGATPDCGPCPRCAGATMLSRSHVAGNPIDSCGDCGGTWMSEVALQTILAHHHAVSQVHSPAGRKNTAQGSPEGQVRYVRCPACLEFMARKNYERVSGVIVDVCPDHGVWLDAGELEALGKFALTGGKALAEKAERAKQELDAEVQAERRTGRLTMGSSNPSLFDGIDLFD